jgi:hypothetical protein
VKNILIAPYPFPYLKQNLKSAIFVSFCITIFLIIFQPFGLNTIQPSSVRIKIIIGYGVVTFIAVGTIAFALLIVEKYTKNEQSWNVHKHIQLLLSNLLLVSIGNFIYSHLIFGLKPNLTNLLWFTFYTFSVGIFPIVFIVIIHQFNQLKKICYFDRQF